MTTKDKGEEKEKPALQDSKGWLKKTIYKCFWDDKKGLEGLILPPERLSSKTKPFYRSY
ncbi:TPA: hypothetical protein HA265_03260 [Candidatus Woesearchaeota archaeon]|nr:hypothetical protein [Candidatus Woesearchaeota archaeon]